MNFLKRRKEFIIKLIKKMKHFIKFVKYIYGKIKLKNKFINNSNFKRIKKI